MTTIKPTKLNLFRLRLFMLLCTLIGIDAVCVMRFLPDKQKRNDTRGRTINTYEFFGDALDDLMAVHAGTYTTKEPDHGSFYLAIEIRSPLVHRLGTGRKADPNQVAIPFTVPARVPGEAQERSEAADAAQAAHDESGGSAGDGNVHRQPAGQESAAEPLESVGRTYAQALRGPVPPGVKGERGPDDPSRKIDLSQIGVR